LIGRPKAHREEAVYRSDRDLEVEAEGRQAAAAAAAAAEARDEDGEVDFVGWRWPALCMGMGRTIYLLWIQDGVGMGGVGGGGAAETE